MNRDPLERAWPAAEPPPGFADRVLERLQQEPRGPESTARRARWSGWLPARPVRWLLLPALALALGGLLVPWSARPDREGEVLAAEPRRIVIGERVVAELSRGAHVRWSGDEAQQDRGEVTYEVVPGAPFRVQTPFGSVVVLGTRFRVVVAEPATEGEAMQKRWAIAGGATAASLAALLWVSVERGSVRLEQGQAALSLGAGQSGSIGEDGVPRLESGAAGAAATLPSRDPEQRKTARQVADAVRAHAARRRAAAAARKPELPAAAPAPGSAAAAAAPAAPPVSPLSGADPERRREYVQRVMREQYFPVARDCYQELLEREPTAGGRVVLEFAIVGVGDAGVVDRVTEREDEQSIDDPEFASCMRESLYTAVFAAPPPGAEETTVVYPVVLSPD